jgi:hypothetical protein
LTFSHWKQKSLFPFQCTNAEVMTLSCKRRWDQWLGPLIREISGNPYGW